MREGNRVVIKDIFNLTDAQVELLVQNKNSTSQFMLYMAALDYSDSSMYTFKQLGYTIHTELDTEVRGYKSPYAVLLDKDVFDRDAKQLFHFIVNRLCRDIMDLNIKLI